MTTFHIDQLDRKIRLNATPVRIISLVPSITELLYDFGLKDVLVGRTKFCVHPQAGLKSIAVVGGTKNINLARVAALRPDFIIANKEENDRKQIHQLSQQFPLWISDISTFSEAMEMILLLGKVLDKELVANQIIQQSEQLVQQLTKQPTRSAAYLILQKPYMTIGKDTYIHDMLSRTGFQNVFDEQDRYPTITLLELKARQPEVILLSSEPFPFKQKHLAELQKEFPNTAIKLVNGEAFSWYGTRFLKTFNYLAAL